MTTTTLQGFAPVTPEQRGTQIEREDLSQGAIVRYVRSRWIDTAKARGFIHTFSLLRSGAARLFCIWGTGELNDVLSKLAPQTILYIRYGGKHPHPELPGAEVHKWEIQSSRAKDITPEMASTIRERAPIELRLEDAIDAARRRSIDKFEQRRKEAIERGEEPPAHTDDDVPF